MKIKQEWWLFFPWHVFFSDLCDWLYMELTFKGTAYKYVLKLDDHKFVLGFVEVSAAVTGKLHSWFQLCEYYLLKAC